MAGADDLGFRQLLEFGRSQQVWVKLSAPYRLSADGTRLARTLYPRLRDAFGLGRLMWAAIGRTPNSKLRTRMRMDLEVSLTSLETKQRLALYLQLLVAFLASDTRTAFPALGVTTCRSRVNL